MLRWLVAVQGTTEVTGCQKRKENLKILAATSLHPANYENVSDVFVDDETKVFINQDEADLLLANNSMRMFITTWKEACQDNNVSEVCRSSCLYDIMYRQSIAQCPHRSVYNSFCGSHNYILPPSQIPGFILKLQIFIDIKILHQLYI